ncbi:50S ribosomal protein L35 [Dethiothermospora halolimnae]|uniref:50S ribosomal protein L35 n=1 Tax=Dethiothermospora halolimnae TaxID=3114390 RepID=UPI003CCB8BB9
MPKMKTHRGAAKRFKKTAKGKIKKKSNYRGHFLTKKTAKRKRQLRKGSTLSEADTKKYKVLLPYK